MESDHTDNIPLHHLLLLHIPNHNLNPIIILHFHNQPLLFPIFLHIINSKHLANRSHSGGQLTCKGNNCYGASYTSTLPPDTQVTDSAGSTTQEFVPAVTDSNSHQNKSEAAAGTTSASYGGSDGSGNSVKLNSSSSANAAGAGVYALASCCRGVWMGVFGLLLIL
ncbi:unnamed protein product [Ambrosiozyma monospora]|uniref:Unnamed protein product n=1 Tax=Ambrosiozyma monospora TaxID=43982 RepID=A0ACB5TZ23_AMBMO|nr:unnamed protein product [Ambrosiozyma monospora]